MDNINKTLYIPLYGKAQVSKRGIILRDTKAEDIWKKERFPLRGKAKSKWLTYFMAMRARVFDDWTKEQLQEKPDALVLHIGCGLDSRILRVSAVTGQWYDIDFPDVIEERKKYYLENETYHMFSADVSRPEWISTLPDATDLIVIFEGISMYLKNNEIRDLFLALQKRYQTAHILMDIYTTFGAKASKYKNPVNTVGVTQLYGIDTPNFLMMNSGVQLVSEGTMTPQKLVDELNGFDRAFFSFMFAGKAVRRIYRLFEYEMTQI